MSKSIKAVYKYYIKNSLNHPLFYICAIIFSVFTSAYFFIKQQFFSPLGTTDLLAFFTTIPYISIIVIPGLCFKHSDSIYDDFIPLKHIYKILIKFAAILTQFTILLILLLIVPVLVSFFGPVDWAQVFTSIFCLFFYGACEISMCLFFVEVFENNISSFIINAVLSAIFNSAHLFAIYVPMNKFFVQFFKQLSFAWHFDGAGKGIIDTRDILFFIIVSSIFIFLTLMFRLKKRGRNFNKNQKIFNLGIILLLVLLLLNSSKYFLRLDCTKTKMHSISSYSRMLLNSAEGSLNITYYRSGNLANFYPQIRDVSDYLQSYCSSSSNCNLLVIDPDEDEKALTLLQNYGVTSQPMRAVKNSNSVEYINVYSAIVIEYKGNVELIPYILSAQTLEYDLTGRIKHLVTGQTRLVNIIVGNDLSLYDSTGYNQVIPWLNSQGFICNPIDIHDEDFATQLDNTYGPLLIIGDDSIRIEQAVAIENYILSKNENALFTVSPYSIDFSNWNLIQNQNTNMVEIIENWGVIFQNRIAADSYSASIVMESQDDASGLYEQGSIYREEISYPLFISILPQNNTNLGLTLFWSTPLELIQDASVQPYLISSPLSWYYEIDRNQTDHLIKTNPFYVRDQDNSSKEHLSQYLAAQIQGPLAGLFTQAFSENSNIIVIPDQYFLSTIMNFGYIGGEYGDFRNFEFMTNCLLKLNNENELAQLQNKALKDNSLSKLSLEKDFQTARKVTYFICFALIPLLILACALIIFILHKRMLKNV